MRPFQELEVWQVAHESALAVYHTTNGFPTEERFGLQSQIRRAVSSVPANIAEGSALTNDSFRHHLRIALGSATELEYHLMLARDLGYLPAEAHTDLTPRLLSVKRMLQRFIQHLTEARRPATNSQQPRARSPR